MMINNTADNVFTSTTLLTPRVFMDESSSQASYKNHVTKIIKVKVLHDINLQTLMGKKLENYFQEKQTISDQKKKNL